MADDLTAHFLKALRESNAIDPAAWAELTAFAERTKPDPAQLAREIRRRRALTDFQLKEVSRGRGKGLTVGPYTLRDLLGEGGMGRVYRARHNRLGKDVALKVIRQEKLSRPTSVRRFHQEIRAAAQLSHPNVVLAYDADEANGVHYFAMEYVEGRDLTKVVAEGGPLPVAKACEAVRQAALGLQHAHERGLVHRDVKPSNLLLTPKGQVKVLDLGLAMLHAGLTDEGDPRVTQDGLVVGTPDFLAPEQAQNPQAVDIRADVYALGGTLYFLLTGKSPYEGETAADKIIKHVTAPPPSLATVLPGVSPPLDALVRWFMAKKPEDRPQTPAQAASALAPFCVPGGTGPSSVVALPAAAPVATPAVFTPAEFVPSEFVTGPVAPAGDTPRPAYKPRKPSNGGGKFVLLAVLLVAGAAAAYGLYTVVGAATRGTPPLPAEFTNPVGMKLIRLEGGAVKLGSEAGTPGHDANESPTAAVTVPGPFYLATTETTHGQFRQVMGESPARWAPRLRNATAAPEDSVTYAEAVEFCAKLTALDKANARPGWAYRLPTEAEWEYAANAGSDKPFGDAAMLVFGKTGIFSLDRELDTKGTLGEADLSKQRMETNLPYPTASTVANKFGLFDLHGNVWEWVGDFYAPGHADNPGGPTGGVWRVQKGGSWKEPAANCRSAARRGLSPDTRRDDAGFRVAFAPRPKS
jgi:serine/threonine protein kinase/formylglycine-generating enzyme required for sulfatase activity